MSDETCIDPSGFVWPVPCAEVGNPCLPDGTALYTLQVCEPKNPPLPEWCALYPTHPVCVANGLPKLPPTGAADTVAIVGSGMLVGGLLCLFAARRRAR